MRENLQCNCHICKIERHLVISLSEPPFSNDFLRLASAAATPGGILKRSRVSRALAFPQGRREERAFSQRSCWLLNAIQFSHLRN